LPLVNSRRIELLDDHRLINQLCGLERRTARGGRDSIDHPPGARDDVVNAVAGLASVLNNKYGSYSLFSGALDTTDDDDDKDTKARDERYRRGLAAHIFNCTGVWPR